MADVSSILREGYVLTAEDADALQTRLLPPAVVRERRLHERDEAIRAALAILNKPSKSAAAVELERLLCRYLAGPEWAADRAGVASEGPPELRRLLHRIALANHGHPLGWRQMLRAACGTRTPLS